MKAFKIALTFASVVATVVATSGSATATKSVGNGGAVVICSSTGRKTYAFLDTFEASKLDSTWRFDLGGFRTIEERIDYLVKRVQAFSPNRAKYYRLVMNDLLANIRRGANLKLLKDEGPLHYRLPSDCLLQQLAIQIPAPLNPYAKLLLVDEELLSMLSHDEQTALLLHETITAEAVQWGAQNSSRIRPFVALLVSNKFAQLTMADFINGLYEAGIYSFEANGFALLFHSTDGKLRLPKIVGNRVIEAEVPMQTSLKLYSAQLGAELFAQGRMTFDHDGNVIQFTNSVLEQIAYRSKTMWVARGDRVTLSSAHRIVKVEGFRNGKFGEISP